MIRTRNHHPSPASLLPTPILLTTESKPKDVLGKTFSVSRSECFLHEILSCGQVMQSYEIVCDYFVRVELRA